jgi:AcrR family transcriptional regulator
VAEHLGRTTGSVTYYFPSKEDMIKSVAISLFDEYDELFQENSEEIDIKSIFNNFILWEKPQKRGTWLVWFHLLPHAATDPALASIFRQRNGRLRAKLAALVARCQQQGIVRSDFSAELLADQITAMTDGWIMMTPVEPSRFKPARLNELVKLSIAMLAPPGKAKSSNRK